MARITMKNSQKATFAEVFEIYISAVTARGVKDKTIATYKQHFHAISKRIDVSIPINRRSSAVFDNMILAIGKTVADGSVYSHIGDLTTADIEAVVKWLDGNVPSWLSWAKEIFKFFIQ